MRRSSAAARAGTSSGGTRKTIDSRPHDVAWPAWAIEADHGEPAGHCLTQDHRKPFVPRRQHEQVGCRHFLMKPVGQTGEMNAMGESELVVAGSPG